MTDTLAASPLAQAIGIALVAFVWQGAIIGIATALMLAVLRRSTPGARYLTACLGLAAMLLAAIFTTVSHFEPSSSSSTQTVTAEPGTAAPAELSEPMLMTAASAEPSIATHPFAFSTISRAHRLRSWLPTIVLLWLGGVAALSLNLIRAWAQVRLLLRTANAVPAADWPGSIEAMAARLGLTRAVRLVESARIDVPAVIGWMRPVIVVPLSVIAGLTPAHLDAILAHELAHVRRRDYLVNMCQCVVETLLFYHPAVWWVSRRIRIEREHCCDDLAASIADSPLTYANALASLETLRTTTPSLAVAATGGELLCRVRRLVEPRCSSIPEFSGGFAMCTVATLLLLVSHLAATPPAAGAEPVDAATTTSAAAVPDETAPAVAVQPQVMTGSIAGVVTDQSGGTIPGATVTLTSAVSAAKRSATTDPMGRFAFPNLPAGAHDITVTLTGFKTWRNRVQLSAGQRAAMEVRLEIGRLSETVELRGTAPPSAVSGPLGQRVAPRGAAAHLEAAQRYYEQGRIDDAAAMTARALELLRAELAERSVPTVEPREPTTGPIRVGGSILEPKKIRNVDPVYPPEAQQAGIQGYVIIEAIIGKDGRVRDARVLGGQQILQEAAETAVRQWEFTPTLLNGVPVEVIMNVTVHFRLGSLLLD